MEHTYDDAWFDVGLDNCWTPPDCPANRRDRQASEEIIGSRVDSSRHSNVELHQRECLPPTTMAFPIIGPNQLWAGSLRVSTPR